jgi:hypothetical protein
MPIADFQTGLTLLQNSLQTLLVRWEATQETWSDPIAEKFAEEHVKTLPVKIRVFVDSTVRLANLLQRAEQDCQ